MAQQELKIIQDFYDFTLWMIHHTEKFPRHHRYSLGVDSTMKDLKNMKRGEWWAKKNCNANNCRVVNRDNNIGFRVALHFQEPMPGIAGFTDPAIPAMKVLTLVPSCSGKNTREPN